MPLNSKNWCDIHRINYSCDRMCPECAKGLLELIRGMKDTLNGVIRKEEEELRCSIVSELRQMAPQTISAPSANESSELSNTTKPSKSSTKSRNIVRLVEKDRWGILIRDLRKSFWVGWHWSDSEQRLCINPFPGLTFWWIKPGGKKP